MYDSYIKAFRWSTDRLDPKNGGIVCFVSNGAWLDGNSTDGFRKSLEKEFDSIYVFNLRGNQRTSGELSRKEGGKIFGSGSRTPISITLLVKNPESKKEKAEIFYKDIGDYFTREEKLKIVEENKTFLNENLELTTLQPNEHGDWINHRNSAFDDFIPLAPEKKYHIYEKSFFIVNSRGLETSRDAWVYNSNENVLKANITRTIEYFNIKSDEFFNIKSTNPSININDFLKIDQTKFSWTRGSKKDLTLCKKFKFTDNSICKTLYRPFYQQFGYVNKELNEYINHFPKFFPDIHFNNKLICLPGIGNKCDFSSLIVEEIPDLGFMAANQTFPLYYYEEPKTTQKGLFDDPNETDYVRRDAVSDFILERAQKQYGKNVTKEDIFYYVYGFLHSPDYRETFASDLKKMLPKLPLVEEVKDFWAFSKAGRQLADLHLNYETIPAYKGAIVLFNQIPKKEIEKGLGGKELEDINYQVVKMKFPSKNQKDTIIYNSQITISEIPEKAYEYVVNGKSAIEWIMERYQITTHKDSGITNNPNDWANEVGNPRYILDLLLSIINVSVQTVDIVNNLPKLNFE